MDVRHAFMADSANLSQDGKLNALGIFETIYAPSYPTIFASSTLVVTFEFRPVDAGTNKRIVLKFITEDGTRIAELEMAIAIPGPPVPPRVVYNFVMPVQGLLIPSEGAYSWHIVIDGSEVPKTIPIEAKILVPKNEDFNAIQ